MPLACLVSFSFGQTNTEVDSVTTENQRVDIVIHQASGGTVKAGSTSNEVNQNNGKTKVVAADKTIDSSLAYIFLSISFVFCFLFILWITRQSFKRFQFLPLVASNSAPAEAVNIHSSVTEDGGKKMSAGRLLMIIAGTTSALLATTMVHAYFFYYFRTGLVLEFEALSALLPSLGIGMAPYIGRRVADAVMKSNTTTT